jgi:hypothetical protein
VFAFKLLFIFLQVVVVAVPEGLSLAVTISLAYSAQAMLADHNLVCVKEYMLSKANAQRDNMQPQLPTSVCFALDLHDKFNAYSFTTVSSSSFHFLNQSKGAACGSMRDHGACNGYLC